MERIWIIDLQDKGEVGLFELLLQASPKIMGPDSECLIMLLSLTETELPRLGA